MVEVNTGPRVAKSVAFAIEVYLTPKKKQAKWSPRKTPAKTIRLLFINERGVCFFIEL